MKQTTSSVKHLLVLLLALAVCAGGLAPSGRSQQRAKSAPNAARSQPQQSSSKTQSDEPAAAAAQAPQAGDDFHISALPPEPPGKIAFASDRAGNFDIYVMNPDGGGLVRLTNDPAEDVQPSWSPDGTKIAFVSSRDGNKEIYIINADGSGLTRLTNNTAEDFAPAWSPTLPTQKIAFVSHRDGNDEVYLMNTDGTSQTNLTQNLGDDDDPTWAPSGTLLGFASNRDGDKFEIYRIGSNGTGLTRLTTNSFNDVAPTWPAGRITFQTDRDGNDEIYTINAGDGSNPVRLTSNTVFDLDPARPPDGARVVFVSNRDAADNLELYAGNSDGSNVVRLTNNPASDIDPSVQPLPSAATLGSIQLSASTYSVNEGQRTLDITVTRTGGTGAASVDITTVTGTASDRTDYTTVTRTLRFAPGEASKNFPIFITDDRFVEPNETFDITLSNPTGAVLGSPATATVTIVDNDTTVAQAPLVRTTAGNIPAEIQATVDQFRADLGGANNGVGSTFGAGRREINWDGVPDQFATPNDLPLNFFNSNSPRGAVFSLVNGATRVQVSARSGSGVPPNFGNINPGYLNTFTPFSPERLFTTLGGTGNVVDVRFFIPGTSTPAVVTGFGSVFSDVDTANTTKIQYFDANGTMLFEQSAPAIASNMTDSFVGVSFGRPIVARVRIINGNSALGPNESGSVDVVVMDDFIYSEPQTVPTSTNPIDESAFFVRQHYIDFLNREPDPDGFNAFVTLLNNCSDRLNNPTCDRITVSSAFARSPEFRLKAEFAIRFYIASFNRLPTYREFIRDLSTINGATAAETLANLARFPADFTERDDFRTIFDPLSNTAYVDRLIANSGVANAGRDQFIADLNAGVKTRDQVLLEIVNNTAFAQAATNRAYVLSQYFGYLRRDPDPAGFTNFLNFLNANQSNFREVTRSFVDSIEYRARFGTP